MTNPPPIIYARRDIFVPVRLNISGTCRPAPRALLAPVGDGHAPLPVLSGLETAAGVSFQGSVPVSLGKGALAVAGGLAVAQ